VVPSRRARAFARRVAHYPAVIDLLHLPRYALRVLTAETCRNKATRYSRLAAESSSDAAALRFEGLSRQWSTLGIMVSAMERIGARFAGKTPPDLPSSPQ